MKGKIIFAFACLFCLNSCALVRTVMEVPVRTLQSVGRTVGMNLEESESSDQPEVQMVRSESGDQVEQRKLRN